MRKSKQLLRCVLLRIRTRVPLVSANQQWKVSCLGDIDKAVNLNLQQIVKDYQMCVTQSQTTNMDWYQFPRSHTAKLDEHNAVQKKTFTRWINSQLAKVNLAIDDLSDLRDGVTLIGLLVILSGERIRPEKGTMRLHRLANVRKAISFLAEQNVKLVNIRAEDIVDGNEKLTQSLIWQIITHYHLPSKEALLQWARVAASADNSAIEIKDFTYSWKDGAAFIAIIRRFRPGLLYGGESSETSARKTLKKAFSLGEAVGVARLLDAEDVDCLCPDEKSIMTYVAALYKVFQEPVENGEKDE